MQFVMIVTNIQLLNNTSLGVDSLIYRDQLYSGLIYSYRDNIMSNLLIYLVYYNTL